MKKIKNSGIGNRNLLYLLIGVIVLTIGYFLMSRGDIVQSPILLIIGYVVLIPIALILPSGNDEP